MNCMLYHTKRHNATKVTNCDLNRKKQIQIHLLLRTNVGYETSSIF